MATRAATRGRTRGTTGGGGAVRRGKARPTGGGGQRRSMGPTLVVLLLVPAVLVLLPTCIVLTLAMLPTAVACYVDRSRDKWLALSVGPLNFCGALFFLIELWGRGHGFRSALDVLGDLYGWLTALAGAAAGWAIYLAMPPIIARITSTKQQLRLAQLRALQDELIEEWGRPVADALAADRRAGGADAAAEDGAG